MVLDKAGDPVPSSSGEAFPSPSKSDGADGRKKPVLVVEDSFDDFKAIFEALRPYSEHFELFWCETADEGIDYLEHEGQFGHGYHAPTPSLVILDLYLPGRLSSLDLLRLVKCDERLRLIPVVVFSTSETEWDRARSFELGADDYVRKPALPEAFREAVVQIKDDWLEIRRDASQDRARVGEQ